MVTFTWWISGTLSQGDFEEMMSADIGMEKTDINMIPVLLCALKVNVEKQYPEIKVEIGTLPPSNEEKEPVDVP